jgi:tRNA (guanosine-2'-O-)-methyltransferase
MDKKIFTTHMAKDSVSLYELNLTLPVALVFGNEHAGVSDEAVRLADGNFLIPQVGMIQSSEYFCGCCCYFIRSIPSKNDGWTLLKATT